MQIRASSPDRPSLANRNRVTSDTTEGAVRRIMGKASNQKKKRRQGTGVSRADLESQRALKQLARAAQKLGGMFEARRKHLAAVSRSWRRGAEPEAAEMPDWAEGSAGDRFFEDSRMKKYAVAPRLATAEIPSAEAVAAEVQYAASGGRGSQPIGGVEGGFPEDDAPVFLLGACCLVDATWAVVGLDPLRDVLDYLGPRLDAALAELNCTLKPSGKMLAETLLRAAADFYRLDEEPADAETMRQLGGKCEGNPLDCLISEKAIEPADVLTIGLAVLATLADLCRTAEASVLVPR